MSDPMNKELERTVVRLFARIKDTEWAIWTAAEHWTYTALPVNSEYKEITGAIDERINSLILDEHIHDIIP